MKRFRFPLRPVGVLRAHRELRARENLAAALQACGQAEERLAEAQARVAGLEQSLVAGRRGRFPAADAAALHRVYGAECQAERQAGREAAAARAALQQRRDEYLEARRALKVVERLEEKARAAHRADNARAEQHELDECAGRAAARPSVLS